MSLVSDVQLFTVWNGSDTKSSTRHYVRHGRPVTPHRPEVGIPGGTGTTRIAYLQAWVFAQWRRCCPQSFFPDSLSTALVWLIIVFASFRFARAPSTAPTPSGSIFAKAAPVIRRRS